MFHKISKMAMKSTRTMNQQAEAALQGAPSFIAVALDSLLVDPNVRVLQELPDHIDMAVNACQMN